MNYRQFNRRQVLLFFVVLISIGYGIFSFYSPQDDEELRTTYLGRSGDLNCIEKKYKYYEDCVFQLLMAEDYAGAVQYLEKYANKPESNMLLAAIYSWPFTSAYSKEKATDSYDNAYLACHLMHRNTRGATASLTPIIPPCAYAWIIKGLATVVMNHRFYLDERAQYGDDYLGLSLWQAYDVIDYQTALAILEFFPRQGEDLIAFEKEFMAFVDDHPRRKELVMLDYFHVFLSATYLAVDDRRKYCNRSRREVYRFPTFFCDQFIYLDYVKKKEGGELDWETRESIKTASPILRKMFKEINKYLNTLVIEDRYLEYYRGIPVWVGRYVEEQAVDGLLDEDAFKLRMSELISITKNFGCDRSINHAETLACTRSRYIDLMCSYYLHLVDYNPLKAKLGNRCEAFLLSEM